MTRLDGSRLRGAGRGRGRGVQAARPLGQRRHRGGPRRGSSSSSTRPTPATRGSSRCSAPGADGTLLPIERALGDSKATKPLADALVRLERILPELQRPGELRRGQVYLSQAEAWELMTVTGEAVAAAGFDVRVPALSRRKPTPGLRLFTEPSSDTVVGAHQLNDVRWSVVFDDVELTAADVARLAAEARPLVRSRGKWVELDVVDLKEAAAALAERSQATKLTGAEILRQAVGLEGTALAGGISHRGLGLGQRAARAGAGGQDRGRPGAGGLRGRAAQLPGRGARLARVPRRGRARRLPRARHGPRQDAHRPRPRRPHRREGPALVIAPPAVVGNWAAEAARFTPGLRVVVHHGASRATADQLDAEIAGADIVITTYGTAVRDVEALAARSWDRIVLDEAQAIKNPANETAQQLRRLGARTRLALTGTPIENGLGDLWAILDFTNPGLVGTRPAFIAQMSGEGEAALRALNGLLVFRRTKSEPVVAAELPDRIDELDHCTMTAEQIGLYQAVLDNLVAGQNREGGARAQAGRDPRRHHRPQADLQPPRRPTRPTTGRWPGGRASWPASRRSSTRCSRPASGSSCSPTSPSGARSWPTTSPRSPACRSPATTAAWPAAPGTGWSRSSRRATGPGALVLSLKAGGTGLNLTAASHVVLYDRWWNPAVEDQARDRAWRIGQTRTVVSHRLVCPGTVDERVEEVVAGKRHIADLVLPKSSSLSDLDADQLRVALGLRTDTLLTEDDT